MSIKKLVAEEQDKLDKQWKEKYPKGMLQVSVMKKDRWNHSMFGYNVIAEVITERPTSHSRCSMGISIQKPYISSDHWPLAYCYNKTIYDSFEKMSNRLIKLNFPETLLVQLKRFHDTRYSR